LVVETIYEPGSTIKPLVAAAALDAKLTHPKEMLDCGNGFMTIGKSRIKDVHPHKELSVFDVVVRSSNIGMSRLGMRLGREQLRETLARFGFGSAGGLPLPGITGGILRASDGWARVDEATHSFGHGFAVTPLQVVRAISSIANGGVMPEPRLFLTQEPSVGQRVISDAVARQVREMMYAVVEDPQGTGRRAAIDRVRVGGKTGTAERVKEGGRGYEAGAYISSFVGFADGAPLGAPRTLSLIIVVDRPNTTSIYGGTLAAPVFNQVMERSLRTLATTATLDPAAHLTRPDIRPVALVHPNIIQRDSI
jgi:cell division protein FtsI (penicillin-binding protein 3)